MLFYVIDFNYIQEDPFSHKINIPQMVTRQKHNNKWKLVGVIIIVIVLDLTLLYFIKYRNQGLSLNHFNLFYAGNFLNLIFALLLIVGVLLHSFGKRNIYDPKLLIAYTFLMTFSLLLAEFYSWLKIPIPNYFVLEHPLKDVLKGILFTVHQFIVFMFISVVWITFLGKKELLILRAAINSIIIATFLLIIAFFHLSSDVEKNFEKNLSSIMNTEPFVYHHNLQRLESDCPNSTRPFYHDMGLKSNPIFIPV